MPFDRHRPTEADRAADFMRRTGQPILTLPRLAGLLGLGEAALALRLEGDLRFRVLATPALLTPATLGSDDDAVAYARALDAAGLAGSRVVILAEEEAATAGTAALVADTMRRLILAPASDTPVAEIHAAAAAAAAGIPDADSRGAVALSPAAPPAGTSTTPLPPPRPPAKARPRRRPPSWPRPRDPGSRRG